MVGDFFYLFQNAFFNFDLSNKYPIQDVSLIEKY